MSGLFTRLARKARGGEIGAARMRVPNPFEAEAPGAEPAGARGAGPSGEEGLTTGGAGAAEPAAASPPTQPRSPGPMASPDVSGSREPGLLSSTPSSPPPAPAPAPATSASPTTSAARSRSPLRSRSTDAATGPSEPDRATTGASGEDGNLLAAGRASAPAGLGPLPAAAATEAVRPASGRNRTAIDQAPGQIAPRVDDAQVAALGGEVDDAPLLGASSRSRPATRAHEGNQRRDRTGAVEDGGERRPLVRVTIGRVEVRGAPPPTPSTRPPAARHQPMGLDEYLRRRDHSGGSR